MSDAPYLVEAIDAGRGLTAEGFTFVAGDGSEHFLSWDGLRADAMNRAAHLRAMGLRSGDRIAIVMSDGRDFVPTFLGAVWAGIVPVPLAPPPSLGKRETYEAGLVAVMGKAEPGLLALPAALTATLDGVSTRVPSLRGVVTAEALRVDAPRTAPREPSDVGADDIAFLQFTSGSTATPKGVEVTHGSLRANAWAIIRDGLRFRDGVDSALSWLPLHHDMGLIGFVLSPVLHKIPTTILPVASFVRNATSWLEALHRTRATMSFAPNFAYGLAARRARPEQIARWDLSRVRVLGCGAEPIQPDTLRRFADAFAPCGLRADTLLPCYGLAEATLAVSFGDLGTPMTTDRIDRDAYERTQQAIPVDAASPPSADTLEVVACGRAFAGHEIGVFDANDCRLGDRRVGELRLRGPSVARGYYRDPAATAATFGGGWLRTGDLGYLADGVVHVAGRSKDLIIVNGRNHDPQCIEWLIDGEPGVRAGSTVAFSIPGALGEELVVVAESRTARPEALRAAIRQRVSDHLQLVAAEVVIAPPGAVPKTSSGKVQRAAARRHYLDSIATRPSH